RRSLGRSPWGRQADPDARRRRTGPNEPILRRTGGSHDNAPTAQAAKSSIRSRPGPARIAPGTAHSKPPAPIEPPASSPANPSGSRCPTSSSGSGAGPDPLPPPPDVEPPPADPPPPDPMAP